MQDHYDEKEFHSSYDSTTPLHRVKDDGTAAEPERKVRWSETPLGMTVLISTWTAFIFCYAWMSWNRGQMLRDAQTPPHRPPSHPIVSTPKSGIFWSACPDLSEYFCSFLTVPLDYARPDEGTYSIALRMLPASGPVKEQLGYMLINPGGPGGSGHEFVVRRGKAISTVVSHKYHIIGFDPRGVNLSSPDQGCFTNQGDASRFQKDFEALGLPGQIRALRASTEASAVSEANAASTVWQRHVDARFKAFDQSCRKNGHREALETSSTATVVRDMKSILDAVGQEKMVYWGFSYGTVIGATYAAMFPDTVGRMWLDGVSDAERYTRDIWESTQIELEDSGNTWDGFFSSCAKSGPKGCALAEKSPTAKDIRARVDSLILSLAEEPVAVGSSKVGPGVVTASLVIYQIWTALYAPRTWPAFAEALKYLENGDGRLMYELAQVGVNDKLSRDDPAKNAFHRRAVSSFFESAPVMCVDTDPKVVESFADSTKAANWTQSLANMSPVGLIWANWVSVCRQYTTKAREVYRGPWTPKDGMKQLANRIVFFSQQYDPATPLRSAKRMADLFGPESSTFVWQTDGLGHCSSAHPSSCTAKLIRNYFLNGDVPEYGTVCKTDDGYLFPHPQEKWNPEALKADSLGDQELVNAFYQMSQDEPIW